MMFLNIRENTLQTGCPITIHTTNSPITLPQKNHTEVPQKAPSELANDEKNLIEGPKWCGKTTTALRLAKRKSSWVIRKFFLRFIEPIQ